MGRVAVMVNGRDDFDPIPHSDHVSRHPISPSLLAPWVYLWLGGLAGGLLGFAAGMWIGVSLPW